MVQPVGPYAGGVSAGSPGLARQRLPGDLVGITDRTPEGLQKELKPLRGRDAFERTTRGALRDPVLAAGFNAVL